MQFRWTKEKKFRERLLQHVEDSTRPQLSEANERIDPAQGPYVSL